MNKVRSILLMGFFLFNCSPVDPNPDSLDPTPEPEEPFAPSSFFQPSVGTKWIYSYSYLYTYRFFYPESVQRRGIHEWEIVSSTLGSDSLILIVQSSQQDTVYQSTWNDYEPYENTFSQTYVLSQVESFPVTITRGAIEIGWISSLSTGWPSPKGDFSHWTADDTLQQIPVSPQMSATYSITAGYFQATYDSIVGLSMYSLTVGAHHSYYERLQLVQFIPN